MKTRRHAKILELIKEHDIDPATSVMFGDKQSDMQAAQAAGIGVRVLLGTDAKTDPLPVEQATHHARSLLSAVTGPVAFLLD